MDRGTTDQTLEDASEWQPPDAENQATRWDKYWHDRSDRILTRLEASSIVHAIEQIGIPQRLTAGALCLDAGCGDGVITTELTRRFGWRTVGLDISFQALSIFTQAISDERNEVPEAPQLVRSSVFECPFPDETFDVVTSFGRSSAATYWPNGPSDIARVLKPGGMAIFDFANHFSFYYSIGRPMQFASVCRRFMLKKSGKSRNPSVEKMYQLGPIGIRDFFDSFGLKAQSARFAVNYPPWVRSQHTARRFETYVPQLFGGFVGRSLIVEFRKEG